MTPTERRAGRKPETLTGSDYRARRHLADADNATLADVGDLCDKVPAAILPALLASGKIERALERRATDAPRRKARRTR